MIIGLSFIILSLIYLLIRGYLAVWHLVVLTNSNVVKSKTIIFQFVRYMNEVRHTVVGLNQRLCNLETEIRLQKSDSSRLVEWLDKEQIAREVERVEFLKALKIGERESKIVELGEQLKLISSRK